MPTFALPFLLLVPGIAPGPEALPLPLGQRIADFSLADSSGVLHRLSDWHERKLIVVVFLGTECPLVKLYLPRLRDLAERFESQGVTFLGIDANAQDSLSEIADFLRANQLRVPILQDPDQRIADLFAARHTPEAFVLDQDRVVRYRGRIDDQYRPGLQRPKASRADLELAITELLAGKRVSIPVTATSGCSIGRTKQATSQAAISYSRNIAPIFQEHCVTCHRPGQIGPFALTSYRNARIWAETIREAVEAGRMPPWPVNPAHGKFANDRRLPDGDKQMILRWIEAGAPEGDPADLPPPQSFAEDGWRIRTPDLVFQMPVTFTVPALGTVPYQYYEVDPGFEKDTWIQEAEVRPGNRSVVHHATIHIRPPVTDAPISAIFAQGELGATQLVAQEAAGIPLILPPGMAKKVPAGWKFVFEVHYNPIGTEQTDRTSLGLVLADPRTVKREVGTNNAWNTDFVIPAGAANHRVESSYFYPQDMLLLSLHPHMHLRGKSFRFEALYPDGSRKVLLDVSRYDIHWETTYRLAEPEFLPGGTTIHCTAYFDNSANNPANPDPGVDVRWGPQIWDEMMIGYIDVAQADQDLTQPEPWSRRLARLWRTRSSLVIALIVCVGALLVLRLQRLRRVKPS